MDIAEFLLARENDREKAAIRTTGYNPGPWTARGGMVKGRVIRSNEQIDGDLWDRRAVDLDEPGTLSRWRTAPGSARATPTRP